MIGDGNTQYDFGKDGDKQGIGACSVRLVYLAIVHPRSSLAVELPPNKRGDENQDHIHQR